MWIKSCKEGLLAGVVVAGVVGVVVGVSMASVAGFCLGSVVWIFGCKMDFNICVKISLVATSID